MSLLMLVMILSASDVVHLACSVKVRFPPNYSFKYFRAVQSFPSSLLRRKETDATKTKMELGGPIARTNNRRTYRLNFWQSYQQCKIERQKIRRGNETDLFLQNNFFLREKSGTKDKIERSRLEEALAHKRNMVR